MVFKVINVLKDFKDDFPVSYVKMNHFEAHLTVTSKVVDSLAHRTAIRVFFVLFCFVFVFVLFCFDLFCFS